MTDESPRTDPTVFTIGHSNHPLATFLALVEGHGIELVVDVRSSPYSGYAAEFNREAIRSHLRRRGVEYLFLGDVLGGRPEGGRFYDEQGYVLYDRLARSPPFQRGIGRLLETVKTRRAALLCGEEDPAGCHRRRLVGRVLVERGVRLIHIRGDGRLQSEEDLAREERFEKTKGQMTLFDLEETETWKSTRSVSPRGGRPTSSGLSGEPGSGA
jgi:uncharacterized protein (DUF488 family)